MTPPLWQKSEELMSFLMKVKEESEKVDLKLNTLLTDQSKLKMVPAAASTS